ncbi:hypothetical protein CHELA20_50820 [Hyphomicrobiales bacterium]|nr:hypothetical protein CHELA20_50820 [Hyphomicrobiales bacterium]CAH1676066.1 hypothetical protein CHELA41_24197 [Hyphomicrobiales bacterium]
MREGPADAPTLRSPAGREHSLVADDRRHRGRSQLILAVLTAFRGAISPPLMSVGRVSAQMRVRDGAPPPARLRMEA